MITNTAIGIATEIKAIRSIEAIRALGRRSARVIRGGKTRVIQAERSVPGDIVLLDAGDVVSADLRLVETADLDADESTLTGESMRVSKSLGPVDAAARVADRTCSLKGTNITRGTGVVVATGMDTELGPISKLVAEAETESSPLEKKLALLSGQLVWLTLAVPIVDKAGKLVGIVTEADLIHRIKAGTERPYSWWLHILSGDRAMAKSYVKSHARKIKDIMTRKIKTADPETPLIDIAELFETNGIKRVPIVNQAGDLIGIVSRANIIQAVASARPHFEITLSDTAIRQKLMDELKKQPWAHTHKLNVTVTRDCRFVGHGRVRAGQKGDPHRSGKHAWSGRCHHLIQEPVFIY